jgi:hypothetical protein
MKFGVLIAVKISVVVSWVVMPYGLAGQFHGLEEH